MLMVTGKGALHFLHNFFLILGLGSGVSDLNNGYGIISILIDVLSSVILIDLLI